MSPRSRRATLAWTAFTGLVLAAGSVAFVKHKDEDNRFCISCHLHEALYKKTFAPEPMTLAAAHNKPGQPGHPERCFTCHSGEGVAGWTAVTALSAWDAGRWLLGDRHEPDSMRLKLENPACLKCHATDLARAATTLTPNRGMAQLEYHHVSDHRGVKTACVACHTAHTDGTKAKDFMADAVIQRECARCHPNGLGTESDF